MKATLIAIVALIGLALIAMVALYVFQRKRDELPVHDIDSERHYEFLTKVISALTKITMVALSASLGLGAVTSLSSCSATRSIKVEGRTCVTDSISTVQVITTESYKGAARR